MGNQVLVAYATKSGSTNGVAEAIGQVLADFGLSVDVQSVSNVKNIDHYQAVIIGSATRMGRLLSEALNFAEKHKVALASKKTAYFTVCLTMQEDTPENREIVSASFKPLVQIKEPLSLGLFSGKYDSSTVNFVMRAMLKKMKTPEGDFRDWEAIKTWSSELAVQLTGQNKSKK